MSGFAQKPDGPEPFGFKVSWFAVKTTDPAAVTRALGMGDAMPANWASGLGAAAAREGAQSREGWIFVSPPVGGWVLVVSPSLPRPDAVAEHYGIGRKFDALFARLAKQFEDVQFFGNQRVVGFVAWARARQGKPVRIFSYADGAVLMNLGAQTPEEASLGFDCLTGLSPADAGDRIFDRAEAQETQARALVVRGLSAGEARAKIRQSGRHAIPDEHDVAALAGLWSIDPTGLNSRDHAPGLGLAVRLPKELAQ